jgi:hypothetical protein
MYSLLLKPMARYLTKSRFKKGLECPTKLYYTNKKNEYIDSRLDDSFLAALAEGGFQVGELAKGYHPNGINIDELDYETSLAKTNKLLAEEKVIIYEAAFLFENLFIRADILIKNGNKIQLIEVKAKSIDSEADNFLGVKGYIISKWIPYLYDISFQKYVIQKAKPEFEVSAYLMLADKSKIVSVDRLNQKFFLYELDGRLKVKINGDVDEKALGEKILSKINVDDIIEKIYDGTASKDKPDLSFHEMVMQLSKCYENDIKQQDALGSKCGKCEFYANTEQIKAGFKSGFHECWRQIAKFKSEDFEKPHVLDVWFFLKKDEYIKNGVYFQEQLTREDLEAKKPKKNDESGLGRVDRQEIQIIKSKNDDKTHYIDIDGLSAKLKEWKFPLHFIDFETTSVAIPFNKGRKPYEQIAFQYSHHIVTELGEIKHKGQWINSVPGFFPNFDFVRNLKKELDNDKGTIFKYAAHENTILNAIYIQLIESDEKDKKLLCDWIKTITHSKSSMAESWVGERDMVDLRDIVLKYYYNPLTNGSNSIKQVLPAVLNHCDYLKEKYSKPIYGKSVASLNFSEHQWILIDEKSGLVKNPYDTLPRIQEDISNEMFDSLVIDEEAGIYDGGAAMTAYARMQFTEMTNNERDKVKEALLRYCELDTLAMVMIWEAWNQWCK